MTGVWYRPLGSRRPGGPATIYHLWYRMGATGRPETTCNGRRDWIGVTPSVEFLTMQELLESGTVFSVQRVGDTIPFDPDYEVDEGL